MAWLEDPPMTHPDPEAAGQAMAEALIAQLDQLKAELQVGAGTPPIVAGEAAVAALKQVLDGLTAGWMPPAEAPAREPFSIEV
jgi:hypothetical protein